MSRGGTVDRGEDCRARWAAQHVFDRHIALEAGAGTGKTATLVARILAWCLGPGWEHHTEPGGKDEETAARVLNGVIGITFTEDAAAEMAHRVARAFRLLSSWEGEDAPSPECRENREPGFDGKETLPGLIRQALPSSPDLTRKRARNLLLKIEHLRLSTIHSFARSLIVRFPLEAGVHPHFVLDEKQEEIADLVEDVVEEFIADENSPLREDFLFLAEKGRGPDALHHALLSLENSGIPPADLARDHFPEEKLEQILEEIRNLLFICRPGAEGYLEVKSPRIREGGECLVVLADTADQRRSEQAGLVLKEMADHLRKYDVAPLLKFREWARGKINKPEPCEDFFRAIKALLPWIEFLGSFDPELFGRSQALLHHLLHRLKKEKKRKGLLGFRDLLLGAHELLKASPEIRNLLSSEIDQLLVDEMQDTDTEQAGIIRQLCLEGRTGGKRPCLFLVGDPKQSIYGWRSADLSVYEALVEEIRAVGGELHSLLVNFRSNPVILEEVERVIEPVMKEDAGVQPPFVPLLPCRRLESEPPFERSGRMAVEYAFADRKERISASEAADMEARFVADDIAGLIEEGENPSEIGILMRSMGRVDTILRALRERGISYLTSRERSYYRRREIIEALALLRLVLDPLDVLALATVLRSPIVGVPDAALASLWQVSFPALLASGDDVADCIKEAEEEWKTRFLPREIQGAFDAWPLVLKAFVESLNALQFSLEEDSPRVFGEKFREYSRLEFLSASRFPGSYRLANIDAFLRRMEEWLNSGIDRGTILRRVRRMSREQPDEDAGRPRGDFGGAVRVMTIHGAKGLEFKHLYLMQHHVDSGRRRSGAALRVVGKGLEIFGVRDPEFVHATLVNLHKVDAENIRLLYVAMTRAASRIVITGQGNGKGGKGPILRSLEKRRGMAEGEGWLKPEDIMESPGGRIQTQGALWHFLGAEEDPKKMVPRPAKKNRGKIILDEDEFVFLQDARKDAELRSSRPWFEGISVIAHQEDEKSISVSPEFSGGDSAPSSSGRPDLAARVGSEMHRILEEFSFETEAPDEELMLRLRNARERLEREEPEGKGIFRELSNLVEIFRSGPLNKRFFELGASILARELPVYLSPEEKSGPVGALLGSIDCLYRDPTNGELVIVDYKTVVPQWINAGRETFRRQLRSYSDALRRAMSLTSFPRCELWYLRAGRIEIVPEKHI